MQSTNESEKSINPSEIKFDLKFAETIEEKKIPQNEVIKATLLNLIRNGKVYTLNMVLFLPYNLQPYPNPETTWLNISDTDHSPQQELIYFEYNGIDPTTQELLANIYYSSTPSNSNINEKKIHYLQITYQNVHDDDMRDLSNVLITVNPDATNPTTPRRTKTRAVLDTVENK